MSGPLFFRKEKTLPNWCEGVLKIRGPKENHEKFFKEGLEGVMYGDNHETVSVPIKEFYYEEDGNQVFCEVCGKWIWIKDTSRAFIDFNFHYEIPYLLYKGNNEADYISVLPFKQAWGVEYTEFAALAKKYELDMRIFAVEQGIGFWCEADITRTGDITVKETGSDGYHNFIWDCPYPILGG